MWKTKYRSMVPIVNIARRFSEVAKTAVKPALENEISEPVIGHAAPAKTSKNQLNNITVETSKSASEFMKLGYKDIAIFDKESAIASFDEVPGPAILQHLAKLWSYVPIIGNQMTSSTLQYALSAGSQLSWGNNLSLFKYLIDEYGPVVRLRGPFGGDVVIISRPEHARIVFKNDGPYPVRSSLDCIEKYRLEYRMYRTAGPFVTSGPKWEQLRNNIEPALNNSMDVKYTKMSSIADDFVQRVHSLRNKQLEVPKSFNDEITKWSMECLCHLIFNKKFGFLDPCGLNMTAETSILLESLKDATVAIRNCEFGLHMWKFFETRSWKKLVQNCDTLDHIVNTYVKRAQESLRERKENVLTDGSQLSLIEWFILKESMSAEDILTVLLDMMLLGVNMTTHSAGFLMYHLARNVRAQGSLYQEISKFPNVITKLDLQQMPYLKACITESLRLKPPMPVLSRILTADINLHGYHIPKGTYMLIATNLSSLREEYFEEANKFKPERWLGVEPSKEMEALASIPFGYGPKACFAKDLAEVQLSYLIIKMLRKYRIEYHYGDIDSNNKLLAAPNRPFRFRFLERV